MTVTERRNNTVVAASFMALLCGVMITLSPTWLHFPQSVAVLNYLVAGLVISTLAGIRAFATHRAPWLAVLTMVLGGWVVISPFVLGVWHYPWTFWTSVIFGTGVVVFSFWGAWTNIEPVFAEDAASQ